MGSTWTRYSQEKLETVHEEVLDQVAKSESREKNAVKFSREKTDVDGDDKGHFIHSIVCESANCDQKRAPIVLVHGYMAGSLMFATTMAKLARETDRRVIAVDWLGCGASARPKFAAKDEHETIDFFLNSFEAWREKKNLRKFDLIGHSMGGYLSSHYVLRGGDEYVNNLILASPVGVPERPPPPENMPFFFRVLMRLWSAGYNPNHIVRLLGPAGESLVNKTVDRRFKDIKVFHGFEEDSDKKYLQKYMFHISAAPGSGEHALSKLLYPLAYAKLPLVDQLPKLASNVDMMIIYGDRDWLARDIHASHEIKANMLGRRVMIETIPGNHHVYMSHDEFHEKVVDFLATRKDDENNEAVQISLN